MNWKNLFFISTAFWIGALILMNCTSPKAPAEEAEPKSHITYCDKPSENCDKIQSQINGYEEMLNSSRLAIIREPGAPIGEVTVSDTTIARELSLLQGYQFSGEEFRQMGELAKNKSTDDKVYVMFAINNDPASIAYRKKVKSPIKYLDIYFQVKTKTRATAMYDRNGKLGLDDYSDFPTPCPPSCP